MNSRKSVLYILLTVLGVILAYNYLIAPLLMQYNTGMGMGMHYRMYNYNNYFIDLRVVVVIALIIAGILLYGLLKPGTTVVKCTKCGKYIENERWKICPMCGTPVSKRRGGGKA